MQATVLILHVDASARSRVYDVMWLLHTCVIVVTYCNIMTICIEQTGLAEEDEEKYTRK